MHIELVMPSSHLILCHPLLLLPPIPPSIRVFSNVSTLHMRWPKYWSFSFSISPSNEHPGLISFRMDWLDLLAVQWTLKSLLQHHSSKLISDGHLCCFYFETLMNMLLRTSVYQFSWACMFSRLFFSNGIQDSPGEEQEERRWIRGTCSPTDCSEQLGGSAKVPLRILFWSHWELGLFEARAGLAPHQQTLPVLCSIWQLFAGLEII